MYLTNISKWALFDHNILVNVARISQENLSNPECIYITIFDKNISVFSVLFCDKNNLYGIKISCLCIKISDIKFAYKLWRTQLSLLIYHFDRRQ